MLLFTHTITPRLKYIAGFIGQEILGHPFLITGDINEFKQQHGPKINYSNDRISDDEIWIRPHSLLQETNIRLQSIDCFEANGRKAFFKTGGDHPFDFFAAAFYLLSRYEEYLPHQKDAFGRYAHENSLAYKENFLDKPLVNNWLNDFRKVLQNKFPGSQFPNFQFHFLPTYDIDEAYSYKHKGWLRSAGAVGKAFFQGQWQSISERRKVLSGKQQDPFDSYGYMDQLHSKYGLKPNYFFLVAAKTGKYDRNILPKEKALQELIKQHGAAYETGIHPSWQSGDDTLRLGKEMETLEKITGKKVDCSRQHFIRFSMPQTFRQLIAAGIRKDFSMGYGSINGFRASVASPFYWYDLEKEETTSLLLFPFCFMEANSFYELKYSPQQALDEMRHYYKEIKSVNGTMITIWHNTFLGTDRKFTGWREVYERFLAEIHS